MKKYTLNKLNVTKILTDEKLIEKYVSKGFKVIKTENDVETFTCEVCGKPYKTEASLKKHISDKHQATENPEQEETNVKNENDVEVETSETNEETESEE